MHSFTNILTMAAMASVVRAQAAPASSAEAAKTAALLKVEAASNNTAFFHYIYFICAALIGFMVVWRITTESIKYVRQMTCLNNDTQRYFAIPSRHWASFKKSIWYAPIGSKRHNKEIQLSAALNVGTLPTRLQFVFLILYFGTNIAFCVVSIHWSNSSFSTVAKEVRNRTGILAVVNMVPLFVMATRNNPLIAWCNMSFDTFNLLHRWFGRIVVLQALAHTGAFIAEVVQPMGSTAGWAAVKEALSEPGTMIMYGLIATVAFVAIVIQASSIPRHAFYETFKIVHISLAILAVIGVWYHLALVGLPQLKIMYGVVTIWAVERASRVAIILYRNIGNGGSRTLLEALPGNAVRVTVDLARPWHFKPGQHAYLYMPSIGFTTSHPFSVAWSDEVDDLSADKLAMNRQDILAQKKTSISFIVRARTGFTATLHKKAAAAPDGRLYTRCFAEGPYGGLHSMHSYGTCMLFAGGVGITHQVPHVRDLVAGFANGTVAARKVILVWIIQSPEHLEWIRPWMTHILAMDKRREVLRIMLFVSRPRSTKEIHSPSATVQMFPGRPNIGTLMDLEMENQVGTMGVTVCGAGALSDDVRLACRERQHAGNIDFIEEAFSW